MTATRRPRGFSLIELLTVIVVMAIIAGVVLTSSAPSCREQLRSAARIVAAELNHTRSLAETNGSLYTVTFDTDGNRLIIQHSGTNSSLDILSKTVFSREKGETEQHILDIDELDCIDDVSLYKVAILKNSLVAASKVEFGPLGETSERYPTLIWLAAGPADARLYLLLTVDPVTGMTSVGRSIGRSAVPLIGSNKGLRDATDAAPPLPANTL